MKIQIFVTIVYCLVSAPHICGANVKFYDKSGIKYESEDFQRCTNFEGKIRPEIARLVTDSCVIVYQFPDCKGSWSKKFVPSSPAFPYNWLIGSFRACNTNEGGFKLNVDITEYFGDDVKQVPDTLERYTDVCSCVNVPAYVQRMHKWSINNHANDLLVFFEPDCSEANWSALFIPAGHDPKSREMQHHNRIDNERVIKIKSFGPDPNSAYFKLNCVQQIAKTAQIQPNEQLKGLLDKLNKLELKLDAAKNSQNEKLDADRETSVIPTSHYHYYYYLSGFIVIMVLLGIVVIKCNNQSRSTSMRMALNVQTVV